MTSNRPRPYSALLASVIAVVSTLLTSSTAATVYVASGAVRPTGEDARTITLFPSHAHRQAHAARSLLDSLVEPLGALPDMDSVTLRTAVAMFATRVSAGAWITADSAAASSVDTLTFLRQWSRTKALPAFWGIRPGFAGVERAGDLPLHTYRPLRRYMLLNEAVADSALMAGDAATAIERARETLAGARHLLSQPQLVDVLVGRVMVERGSRLLVRAAQQGDDPLTAGAARRLDALSRGAFTVDRAAQLAYRALGTRPNDGRLLSLASDTSLHPALRMQAFVGLFAGACLHPREVLFGMSSERRLVFQQIAQAVEDIPRGRDLAALHQKEFDHFDDGLTDVARKREAASRGADSGPLSWVVPRIVTDRVAMCRRM